MDQTLIAFVTDYDMVSEHQAWNLAKKVTEGLKKGYILYGQPFMDKDGRMCQAMVKVDERLQNVLSKTLDNAMTLSVKNNFI